VPSETILLLYDQLHITNTTPVVTASSTANGYNLSASRRPSWASAWKPADGTADEYLMVDGGSAGWLGTTGGTTIYYAVAVDARLCDQGQIQISQDTASGGTFATKRAGFVLDKRGPTVHYGTFPLSTSGRQFYRIEQNNALRNAGTKTCRVFGWSFYRPADVVRIGIDNGDMTAPTKLAGQDAVGTFRALSGHVSTNRNGGSSQRFELRFSPGDRVLWQQLLTYFLTVGGAARPFYVVFEGLRNLAVDGVQLCRLDADRWDASRVVKDEYDMTLPLVTEGAF